MRTEANTPVDQRYLMLCDQLSPARFDEERNAVIRWCNDNGQKLNESNRRTLDLLRNSTLSENARAFVVAYCYADIPTGRNYDLVFEMASTRSETVNATLRFGLFWSRLPVQTLEHGHTQVAFFTFDGKIPSMIDSLPVAWEHRASSPSLAFCSASDWGHIQKSFGI